MSKTFSVDVEVSTSEVAASLSDDELMDEIEARSLQGLQAPQQNRTEIKDTLIDAADLARIKGKNGLALRLDDLRHQLFTGRSF